MNTYLEEKFRSDLDTVKYSQKSIDTAIDYVLDNIGKKERNSYMWIRYAVAACVVLLFSVGGFGAYKYINTPVAFVDIEINPGIELGVSCFNKVVWTDFYNSEGEMILKELKMIGRDVGEATEFIVESAINKGFITGQNSSAIAVIASADKADLAEKLEREAALGAQKAMLAKDVSAHVYKGTVTPDFRLMAIDQNIAPGKMDLIQKLQVADPSVDPQEYKDARVKDLLEKIDGYRAVVPTIAEEEPAYISPSPIASSLPASSTPSPSPSPLSGTPIPKQVPVTSRQTNEAIENAPEVASLDESLEDVLPTSSLPEKVFPSEQPVAPDQTSAPLEKVVPSDQRSTPVPSSAVLEKIVPSDE